MSGQQKVLVITGGSSGIGKATAQFFADRSYRVYELSRHGVDSGDIRHIDCDVTDAVVCGEAVHQVIAQAGKVDVLICNAGMGISGAVEFTAPEAACLQMSVNFHGTMNVVNAVLPHMRELRQGHIIFVSSLAAVFPIPFQAYYSASKAALNAIALALANEARPYGLKVCCLLPGDVKTGFADARNKNMAGAEVYKNMERAVSTMERDENNGLSPIRLARKLYKMAETPSPDVFYTVGLKYHLFLGLSKVLPATFVNWVVGKLY